MQFRSLTALGLVAGLVVVGCAKKREVPARGSVIGTAQFSSAVMNRLETELGVKADANCLQVVELSDAAKSKVVELSSGKCAEGQLASNVIATMKISGDSTDTTNSSPTYLMMGESSNLADNTPVATLVNVSAPNAKVASYEVDSLCQKAGRMDFARSCKVEATEGAISKINYSAHLTLTRMNMEMGLINLENFDTIQKQREELETAIAAVNKAVTEIETRVGVEEGKATNLLSSIKKIEEQIGVQEKNLKSLQEKSATTNKMVTDMITSQEAKLQALKDNAAFKEIQNKLTNLTKELDALKSRAMDDVLKSISEKIASVNGEITKLDADAKKSIDTVTEGINNAKKNLETFGSTSKESLDTLKAEVDAAETKINSEAVKKTLEEIRAEIRKLEELRKPVAPAPAPAPANGTIDASDRSDKSDK